MMCLSMCVCVIECMVWCEKKPRASIWIYSYILSWLGGGLLPGNRNGSTVLHLHLSAQSSSRLGQATPTARHTPPPGNSSSPSGKSYIPRAKDNLANFRSTYSQSQVRATPGLALFVLILFFQASGFATIGYTSKPSPRLLDSWHAHIT